MKKETWKDVFCNQVDDGKYWKNLFKDEFDKHQFLDRNDAVYICKKAQADCYENIINKLEGKIDATIIDELKQILDEHWKNDDSALGMFVGGKQINL
jgi:hypothetical protein